MDYNLIVLGAGPAGYTAALKAKQAGLNVALVEKGDLGGTCLNEGCIPTKSLLRESRKEKNGDTASFLQGIYKTKDATIARLKSGLESLFTSGKIPCIKGEGSFISNYQIQVNNTVYSAKNFLIATGATPSLPPIPGIEHTLTSKEILSGEFKLPSTLAIIGGGVIGVEFATFFSHLGVAVTIYEALPRILTTFSEDAAKYAGMLMRRQKISIITSVKANEIKKAGDSFLIVTGDGEKEFDLVISATGRKPVLPKGLQRAGVQTERGGIVAPNLTTTAPGIYAIGDVVYNNVQLAHYASYQAGKAVEMICNKIDKYTPPPIPQVVYLDTEVASVGLLESQAIEKGLDIAVGRASTAANGKSLIEDKGLGYYKAVFDKNTLKLLGAEIVAHNAGEIIGGLGALMSMGITLDGLMHTCWPHPTVSEGFYQACENVSR